MDSRDSGAAWRRRQRRLRRHEQLTLQMAVAEQLHHSANRVERDVAPRRLKTPFGDRSGLPRDAARSPAGPWAAVGGSHGRSRGCPSAAPFSSCPCRWRRLGRRGAALPGPAGGLGAAAGGGGSGGEEGGGGCEALA